MGAVIIGEIDPLCFLSLGSADLAKTGFLPEFLPEKQEWIQKEGICPYCKKEAEYKLWTGSG